MFFGFLDELRAAGIPASLKEHLMLLEALDREVIDRSPEQFYYLSRAIYVKDEGLLDRFDQVFNKVFKGIISDYGQNPVDVPADWLKAVAEKFLTPEEMAAIESLGDWDKIMETLKERLEEQQKRHEGGSKWIGTGGRTADRWTRQVVDPRPLGHAQSQLPDIAAIASAITGRKRHHRGARHDGLPGSERPAARLPRRQAALVARSRGGHDGESALHRRRELLL